MSHDLISKRTRMEFREHFVGWYVLRTISAAFENEDIYEDATYNPPESGQRRWLVERFYHSIDFSDWSQVSRLLRVYETALLQVPEDRAEVVQSLLKWLKRDGFDFIDGRITGIATVPRVSSAKQIAAAVDAAYLRLQIDRMEKAIEADPDLAVDSAKALVETICKTILKERGQEPSDKLDVPQLVRATQEELKLVPDGVDHAVKGADSIKRVLGSLSSITNELAHLRNLYGSSHGRHGKAKGLTCRHAKLAVGAASTLAVFLYETHVAQTKLTEVRMVAGANS